MSLNSVALAFFKSSAVHTAHCTWPIDWNSHLSYHPLGIRKYSLKVTLDQANASMFSRSAHVYSDRWYDHWPRLLADRLLWGLGSERYFDPSTGLFSTSPSRKEVIDIAVGTAIKLIMNHTTVFNRWTKEYASGLQFAKPIQFKLLCFWSNIYYNLYDAMIGTCCWNIILISFAFYEMAWVDTDSWDICIWSLLFQNPGGAVHCTQLNLIQIVT